MENVKRIERFIDDPKKAFYLSLLILFVGLILDQSLFESFRLLNQEKQLKQDIARLSSENTQWRMKIERAKDPQFIQRQAQDRFDLVRKEDLVFYFSNDQ